jgi:hypothetical protein
MMDNILRESISLGEIEANHILYIYMSLPYMAGKNSYERRAAELRPSGLDEMRLMMDESSPSLPHLPSPAITQVQQTCWVSLPFQIVIEGNMIDQICNKPCSFG